MGNLTYLLLAFYLFDGDAYMEAELEGHPLIALKAPLLSACATEIKPAGRHGPLQPIVSSCPKHKIIVHIKEVDAT